MSEDTPANRLKEVILRFQTIREPLIQRRKLKRKAFLDMVLDSLKARTEAKTSSTRSDVQDLIEENKALKEKLKKEKEEEEDSHSFAGRGVRKAKDGRDIAIEL